MKKLLALILWAFLLFPIISYSHQPDQSIIYMRVYEEAGIDARFEINVNQLNEAFGLNLPKYPKWADIEPHVDMIKAYLLKNTSFSSKYGDHKILFTDVDSSMVWTSFGYFVKIPFHLENSETLPDDLLVTYSAFIKENPNTRNLLTMEYNWKAGLVNNETMFALDFKEGAVTKTLDLTEKSYWKGFVAMVEQGIWHIWIGLDHILFLLALILPSVVRRTQTATVGSNMEVGKSKFNIWGWAPVDRFRPAFLYILKIITFFTIAHTITLSLAALNIIVLPSRLVESIIALSIGLAAYHNIKPIFKGKDWLIAFVFGLFHGFGFASVMGELGFKGEFLTLTLLGFNVGVEIGQVLIIALIFPILYFLRNLKSYPKILVYLSAILIVVSLYWLVERAFDIDLPLDESIRTFGGDILRALGLRRPVG
ncbi:HupE/UreJ family protein [Maribacter sp. 2308TA10-17]|uniref:HupE/UreJ family protein n=1 Tax=Maribacter sp. 2308TA10-17 TaxID=3386276 RepID=UPI0039BC9904